MKFLCLDCDQPMKLHGTEGPHEGSLAVTFRCPECGFRVAMLTNPFETQMVKSLGVTIGGRSEAPAPFDHLRTSMTSARADVFAGAPAPATGDAEGAGPGCPFAGMLADGTAPAPEAVAWTPEARARMDRVPEFIRPMARKAIERYAESKGYASVTEPVLDEARAVFGM
jgi:DNA-directed RNA polymerase subunit RPC12/RpoP